MTHGTYASYTHGGCRCTPCRAANSDHQRKYGRRWYNDLTRKERSVCLICKTPIGVHPIRACWREQG